MSFDQKPSVSWRSCVNCSCSLLNWCWSCRRTGDKCLGGLVRWWSVGFCRRATLPSIGAQRINTPLKPTSLASSARRLCPSKQMPVWGWEGWWAIPVTRPRSGGLLLHRVWCVSIGKLLSGSLIPWDFKQPRFSVFDIHGTLSKQSARWSSWLYFL